MNIFTTGRVAESLPWAEEMLDLAKATGDADLLITGHELACVCYSWPGEFTKALEHADRVMDLYDDEKHRHLADILNQDPKTLAGVFGSISTWILGYPDRAMRLNDEKDAHARRRGHPFDLGLALINGAHEFDHRCKHEDLRKRAEDVSDWVERITCPCCGGCWHPSAYGQALIREGKVAEAIAQLRASIASWEASGGKVRSPTTNVFLAEGMALTGDLDNALHLIGELIAHAERPGWEERLHYAEILRLQGLGALTQGRP